MNRLIISSSIALVLFLVLMPGPVQTKPRSHQTQGNLFAEVPPQIDPQARYLFYLHGYIVNAANPRPTSERFGVYEYAQILDTFKQSGFVVISEPRKQTRDLEPPTRKVVGQVRQLLKAGVPPGYITVVGASQGSWITMLASTYLENRKINFVIIAGCAAETDFLKLVNLHGNVLSIYEESDLARSCQKFQADATGLGEYQELQLHTGLQHGFIYRPMKEWVDPVIAWAGK